MKNLKALWCASSTQDFCNFGDTLTSYVLKPFDINAIYETKNPDIIGIGSLIHMLQDDTDALIWSTGLMYPTREFHFKKDPLAVRGKLTLKQIKNDTTNCAIGDGALLLEKIYKPKFEYSYRKRYRLGIVPNYVDIINMRDDKIEDFNIFKDPSVCLIDTRNYVETVADKINSCDNIISSSLHGIITADSYEINNAVFESRETSKALFQMQGGFKFKDHYSAFDQNFEKPAIYLDKNTTVEQCLSVCKPFNKPNLESIKQGLIKSIEKLKEIN